MIARIVEPLIGLFIEDGLLAAGTLIAVAAVATLTLTGALPTAVAGLMLVFALPALLAASVLLSVKRARRQ